MHGRSAIPRELSSHDPLPNYLTLLPGPLVAPAARRLRYAHLCYQSLHPHPLWNPFHVMHSLGLSSGGPACPFGAAGLPTLALGLFSVDLLRHVHAAVRLRAGGDQQQVQAQQQLQQWQGDRTCGSSDSSGSSSSSGHAEFLEALDIRWSEVACWQTAAAAESAPAAVPEAEVLLAAPAAVLDVEAAAFAALQSVGIPTSWLQDYAAVPVMQGCWRGRDGTLVLVLLRLQDLQHGSEQTDSEMEGETTGECCTEEAVPAYGGWPRQQRRQAQQRCGAHEQSACLLLHAAAVCGTGSTLELLHPPYPWQVELSQDLVQQLALAGVCCREGAAASSALSVAAEPPYPFVPLPHQYSRCGL